MTIVYLYSEVMGYTLGIIKSLIQDQKCKVHLVYWDSKKKTPFEFSAIEGLSATPRSAFANAQELYEWCADLNPSLLYVSGRMDKAYLDVAKRFRSRNIPVVSGLDTQWYGNVRQYVASLFSSFIYKKYFEYLWVAGPLQYVYAMRLGYDRSKIIPNLYSADTFLFAGEKERKISPVRTLLFVGRLDPVKGIQQAVQAFIKVQSQSKYQWKFKVIGSGPLDGQLTVNPFIEYIPFLLPEQLKEQVDRADAFVLPSILEPWGVVIHEMVASGLPLLSSNRVGANEAFLIHGHNGYIFKSGEQSDLESKMLRLLNLSDEELLLMGTHSTELAKRITSQISAASLCTVLEKDA